MKINRVVLSGPLGQALKLSGNARLKTLDYHLLAEPFRQRYETDGGWRCEFWGKVVRSTILSQVSLQDEELAEIIEGTVQEIMSTQRADGGISSYPIHMQLAGWDIWGRKYVLYGLTRYYELINPSETVKTCCIRVLDHLIAQLGGKGENVVNFGCHEGLAACSMCDAVLAVYRISKEPRFLEFARGILRSGASLKHNIFDAVMQGTLPADLGNGKAYEMTSCFQGLAELYMLDPKPEYKAICLKYYEAVRDHEIFVTGAGGGKDSVGEYWCNGTLEQTAPREGSGLGETCVTTTWLHYCDCIYRMTGDAAVAGEAEKALYNGILGALAPDGTNWLHKNPTPLTGGGVKNKVKDQMISCFGTPFDGNDCCRAQGPEALAMAPLFAVTAKEDGVAVNIFEAGRAEFEGGSLEISGGYPYLPQAKIHVQSAGKTALYLRVAPWLASVKLNGKSVTLPKDGYLRLEQAWSAKDELVLDFDFTLREVAAPGDASLYAVTRGPLVLAEDIRGFIPAGVHTEYKGHVLSEYAAAGCPFDNGYSFTVWFKK